MMHAFKTTQLLKSNIDAGLDKVICKTEANKKRSILILI